MSLEPLYSQRIFSLLKRSCYIWVGLFLLSLLLCAGAIAVLLSQQEYNFINAVSAGLLTALPFALGYVLLQRQILPAHRVRKILTEQENKPKELKEGRFLGYRDGLSFYKGVLMQVLRLDTGLRVHRDSIPIEVYLPACFERLTFKEGSSVSFQTYDNLLTSCSPLPAAVTLKPGKASYSISWLSCILIVIVAELFWGTLFASLSRLKAEPVLQVAVCSLSHSDTIMTDLSSVDGPNGKVGIAFSYTDTPDPEQTAAYLSTFGVWEADILLLDAYYFESVFGEDGAAMTASNSADLSKAVGFTLEFVHNKEGQIVGVVLYDPQNPDYSSQFPLLDQWIQLTGEEQYLAVLNERSKETSYQGLKALLAVLSNTGDNELTDQNTRRWVDKTTPIRYSISRTYIGNYGSNANILT